MYQTVLTNTHTVQYSSNHIGASKSGINFCGRNHRFMKYFFWISFAVFLAASIPHVAYFFASFEPSQGPEGVWWWTVSYAIAISIDVTVYLLSWTAFQRYRRYRTAKAVWQHWLLIVMCTVFSWAVNWAYSKQFYSMPMLNAAETAAPWLTNVFPFMASAFPLLGIVYTLMPDTNAHPIVTHRPSEGRRDKLQMTIEALRSNPDMTDEALAEFLSLKRPASARFWRLKAIEILNAPGSDQTGKTPVVRTTGTWSTPAGAANGSNGKR